jgi:signal transduction histidine kinase
MDYFVIAIIAAVGGGAVGLLLGRSAGRRAGLAEGHHAGLAEGRAETSRRLSSMVDAVKRGRAPEGIEPGSPEAELKNALAQGWAPKEVERETALREAVGRVSAFLDKSVRAPLTGFGPQAVKEELAERIERALGALTDLEFFVRDIGTAREGTNLIALVQSVSREFAADQNVGVRLRLGDGSVRAVVNAQGLMDAIYLVLHNAGRFGGGGTVDVLVEQKGGRARIVARDRGRGFTEEAFTRAFDPFYSTTDDGLGLGLPHARKVVEEMGGRIELRNVPDGGAEVEISFDAA